MSYRKAPDELFIKGTIRTVSEIGIENTRTKQVADYAGFSESTMYKRFPTKEILLRDTFLYIDKQISNILTQSSFILNPGNIPFEMGIYTVWHRLYRYLIDNKEETMFLIRYRYSSLYTSEVRGMRQAYSGAFKPAYTVFEKYIGKAADTYGEFLINYIFEVTLCFAEKILSEKIEDTPDTEYNVWLTVSNAVKSWTRVPDGAAGGDKQRLAEAQ